MSSADIMAVLALARELLSSDDCIRIENLLELRKSTDLRKQMEANLELLKYTSSIKSEMVKRGNQRLHLVQS